MKLYVLDEPLAPRAQGQAATAPRPRSRRSLWFRSGLALVAIGACSFYLAGVLPSSDDGDDAHAATRGAPVAAALTTGMAVPPPAPIQTAPASPSPEPIVATPPAPSSVVRRNGKFFIDLHSVEPGAAVAMLSRATGMTVLGDDALLQHPAPLSASAVTASPVAAWQWVFGDIANFAVSCAGKACVVHFVAAAAPAASRPYAPPASTGEEAAAPPSPVPVPGTTVYSEEN
jgi:hypothetical protein